MNVGAISKLLFMNWHDARMAAQTLSIQFPRVYVVGDNQSGYRFHIMDDRDPENEPPIFEALFVNGAAVIERK